MQLSEFASRDRDSPMWMRTQLGEAKQLKS